jgi:hypothetical protein
MADHLKPAWQKIAAKLAKETDSEKLLHLAQELIRALDQSVDCNDQQTRAGDAARSSLRPYGKHNKETTPY